MNKHNRRIELKCIVLVLVVMAKCVNAQTGFKGALYEDLEVTNSIIKSFGDSVYHFQVKAYDEGRTISVVNKRFYWFNQGEVKTTVGSSAGKVLHGKFEQFDREGNLKEKGIFRNGAKEGLWLRWYPNGQIASKYFWKEGFREGRFDEYFETGKISRSGTFKQDLLNGKISTYQPGGMLTSTTVYKKGIEQKKKQKKEKKKKDRGVEEKKEQVASPTKDKRKRRVKDSPPPGTVPRKKLTLFKKKEQSPVIDPAYEKKN